MRGAFLYSNVFSVCAGLLELLSISLDEFSSPFCSYGGLPFFFHTIRLHMNETFPVLTGTCARCSKSVKRGSGRDVYGNDDAFEYLSNALVALYETTSMLHT